MRKTRWSSASQENLIFRLSRDISFFIRPPSGGHINLIPLSPSIKCASLGAFEQGQANPPEALSRRHSPKNCNNRKKSQFYVPLTKNVRTKPRLKFPSKATSQKFLENRNICPRGLHSYFYLNFEIFSIFQCQNFNFENFLCGPGAAIPGQAVGAPSEPSPLQSLPKQISDHSLISSSF